MMRSRLSRLVKVLMDYTCAVVALVPVLLATLIIAALIKMEDGGPVIF